MDLVFELGDESTPRGHALAYFTAPTGEVYATYVQTFPIPMDLAQYLPQVFASMVTSDQIDSQTATAMPPVAQLIEGGVDWLRDLAETRHDDLVNAGTMFSVDPVNLMGMTHELVTAYSDRYKSRDLPESEPAAERAPLLEHYSDLTEGEKLTEITNLVGRLRDALGSGDAGDVEEELHRLASTMPAKYRAIELVRAASTSGQNGQELATLYLQRAYLLLNEDYLNVPDIERQILAIELGETQPSDS